MPQLEEEKRERERKKEETKVHEQPVLTRQGLMWMGALVVQCGVHPFLMKTYLPPHFNEDVFVFCVEMMKIFLCLITLLLLGNFHKVIVQGKWTVREMIIMGGPPSILYTIISRLLQDGYRLADPLVATLVQQSKMLWTALFLWQMMGIRQSKIQLLSFIGIIGGVTVLSLNSSQASSTSSSSSSSSAPSPSFLSSTLPSVKESIPDEQFGAFILLLTSFLSGLASGLVQRILWGRQRNTFLYSAEMAGCIICILFFSNLFKFFLSDEDLIGDYEWRAGVLIPMTSSAVGGVIVGQVTSHVGGVWKGLAIIGGILFCSVVRWLLYSDHVSVPMMIAFPTIVLSSYAHLTHPVTEDSVTKKEKELN